MKKSILILSAVIAFFITCSFSCEDPEPFISIKTIESQIHSELKAYRIANGISADSPFVLNHSMVKEAQLYSLKMSFGSVPVDTSGIAEHWTVIHDKFGGKNDATLVQSTLSATAADIVAAWTADSASNALILSDVTQCGAGVEYGTNQTAYVTVFMMWAE